MSQNVMITGTGRRSALGFNLVLRYLEAGDNVVATIRKESEALSELKEEYGERLHIVGMDIGVTESVERAASQVENEVGRLDLLINNAVLSALGMDEDFLHADMDSILDLDYAMAKAAVNMGTMTFYNATKDDPGINIFCVHPGWIRTDGREDNPAPLSSYEAAETLRLLFEKRRYDKQGHRFITYENEDYPF